MGGICAVLGEPGDPELSVRLDRMLARSPYRGEAQRHLEGGLAIGIQSMGWDASLHSAGNWLVAFHGYIGNWDELAPAHGLDLPSDADNTHRIAIAYEALGDDLFVRLRGEFAIVILDRRSHQLIAVRDILGCRPLFTAEGAGRTYLASEIRQVITGAQISPRLNHDVMLDRLIRRPREISDTLYDGVSRLLAATIARFRPADWSPISGRLYWQPPAEGHNPVASEAEAANALRNILIRAVSRCLPSQPFTATLSGGVDSNAVWALIRELDRLGDPRASNGRPISLLYPGEGMDESETIRTALDAHGLDGILASASNRDVLASIISGVHTVDHPVGWALPEYRIADEAAVADGRLVMLSGLGGDEWLTGGTQYLADLAQRGRAVRLTREILRLRSSGSDRVELAWRRAIRPAVAKALRFVRGAPQPPAWIADPWRSEAKNRITTPLEKPAPASRTALLDALVLWRGGAYGEMDEQAAAVFGVENRAPLNDLDLIEFAFGTRPWILAGGNRRKHLFRRAVGESIPRPVRDRLGKTDFAAERIVAGRELAETEIIKEWALVRCGILDAQEVDRVVHTAKLGTEHLYGCFLFLVENEYFARYMGTKLGESSA